MRFLFIVFLFNLSLNAQDVFYFQNFDNCVYVDQTNVREKPSVSSPILGQLPIGEVLESAFSATIVDDTINDRPGNWKPINYHNKTAYVWSHTLSDFAFKSHKNPNQTFIMKYMDAYLQIRLIENHKVIYKDSLEIPYNASDYRGSCTSLGVLDSTENSEIIVLRKKERSKVWAWDGKQLKPYTKPVNHPILEETYKKPIPFKKSIISGNEVNCRNKPSTTGEIVMVLPQYTLVDVLEEETKHETIGGYNGWWVKIKYNNKEGYVWCNYIDHPKQTIEHSEDKGLRFVVSYKRVFVVKNGQLKSHVTYSSIHKRDLYKAYMSGNGGLEELNSLLHLSYSGESCGVPSGEFVLGWNGQNLNYLFNSSSAGDVEIYTDNQYFLPIQKEGSKGKVIHLKEKGIQVVNPRKEGEEDKIGAYPYYKKISEFEFKNGSLEPISSKYDNVFSSTRNGYSKEEVSLSFFGDFNGDQIEDAVVVYTIEDKEQLVVYQGRSDGTFKMMEANKPFLPKHLAAIDVHFIEGGIKLNLLKWTKILNQIDDYHCDFQELDLQYNKTEGKLIETKNTVNSFSEEANAWKVELVENQGIEFK